MSKNKLYQQFEESCKPLTEEERKFMLSLTNPKDVITQVQHLSYIIHTLNSKLLWLTEEEAHDEKEDHSQKDPEDLKESSPLEVVSDSKK